MNADLTRTQLSRDHIQSSMTSIHASYATRTQGVDQNLQEITQRINSKQQDTVVANSIINWITKIQNKLQEQQAVNEKKLNIVSGDVCVK